MPMIDGVKWSCEPCMRGHRSSKCNHTDRILVKVRKPGRPLSSCPHSFPGKFVNASPSSVGTGDEGDEAAHEHGCGDGGCDCFGNITSVAIPKGAGCSCGGRHDDKKEPVLTANSRSKILKRVNGGQEKRGSISKEHAEELFQATLRTNAEQSNGTESRNGCCSSSASHPTPAPSSPAVSTNGNAGCCSTGTPARSQELVSFIPPPLRASAFPLAPPVHENVFQSVSPLANAWNQQSIQSNQRTFNVQVTADELAMLQQYRNSRDQFNQIAQQFQQPPPSRSGSVVSSQSADIDNPQVQSHLSNLFTNAITSQFGEKRCNCGTGCQCIGCPEHPYNSAMLNYVKGLNEVASANPPSPEDSARTFAPPEAPKGSCCMGSRGTPVNITTTPESNYSIPGFPSPTPIPTAACCASSNGKITPATHHAQPPPQTPTYDRTPYEEIIMSPSDFFTIDYPLGPCSEQKEGCNCGAGCKCVGCLVHDGDLHRGLNGEGIFDSGGGDAAGGVLVD